jgi:hypothetical protein
VRGVYESACLWFAVAILFILPILWAFPFLGFLLQVGRQFRPTRTYRTNGRDLIVVWESWQDELVSAGRTPSDRGTIDNPCSDRQPHFSWLDSVLTQEVPPPFTKAGICHEGVLPGGRPSHITKANSSADGVHAISSSLNLTQC